VIVLAVIAMCLGAAGETKEYDLEIVMYQFAEAPKIFEKENQKPSQRYYRVGKHELLLTPFRYYWNRGTPQEQAVSPFNRSKLICKLRSKATLHFQSEEIVDYLIAEDPENLPNSRTYTGHQIQNPDELKIDVTLTKGEKSRLRLEYKAHVSRMAGREVLDGVHLDVGKPIILKADYDSVAELEYGTWFLSTLSLSEDVHIVILLQIPRPRV